MISVFFQRVQLKLIDLTYFQLKTNGQKSSMEAEEDPGSDSEVEEDNGNLFMMLLCLSLTARKGAMIFVCLLFPQSKHFRPPDRIKH